MLELFRIEAETQTAILTGGLLELERGSAAAPQLEALMRAAHSLKGAARIVNLPVAVRVAHAMEDCFVAAQRGKSGCARPKLTCCFAAWICFSDISKLSEADIAAWETGQAADIQESLASLAALIPLTETGPPPPLRPNLHPPARRMKHSRQANPPRPRPSRRAGRSCRLNRPTARRRPQNRSAGTRGAADRGKPESPARPGRRIAGRVPLAAPILRLHATAQATAI